MQSKDVANSAIDIWCPHSPWNGFGRQGCTTVTKWVERTEVLSGWKVIRSKEPRIHQEPGEEKMVLNGHYFGVST